MTIKEFLKKTNKPYETTPEIEKLLPDVLEMNKTRPRVICKDGFSISVQAGWYMYSSPRKRSDDYDEVELGFPSQEDKIIMPYAEDREKPTETVYPYTPIKIVEKLIEKHGGIDVEKTFAPAEEHIKEALKYQPQPSSYKTTLSGEGAGKNHDAS